MGDCFEEGEREVEVLGGALGLRGEPSLYRLDGGAARHGSEVIGVLATGS